MELNPLAQLNAIAIVGAAAVFVLTYFALRRVWVDRVVAVMEARRARTDEAARMCAEARRTIAFAEEEAARIVGEARLEAETFLEGERQCALKESEVRLTEAHQRVELRLEEGRVAVSKERDAELELMRREAEECVQLVCSKLLGEVDAQVVSSAVDGRLGKEAA